MNSISSRYFPLFQQSVIAAPPITNDEPFNHGTDDPKIDDYATNFDPLIEALVNMKSNATSGSKNLFVEIEKIRRNVLDRITTQYRKAYDNIMSSSMATGAQKQESFAKLKQATNESLDSINSVILKHKGLARTLISSLESNQMIWQIKEILLNASIHQNETSTKLHELSSNVRVDVYTRYKQFEQTMNDIEAQFRPETICSTEAPPRQTEIAPVSIVTTEKVWSKNRSHIYAEQTSYSILSSIFANNIGWEAVST